ncbi:MAG: hypothetical protein ABEH43_08755 [Flavobacteriales bacterium]
MDVTNEKSNKQKVEEMDNWYKYGVFVLYLEMAIAIGISIYSIYMAFTGSGTFIGH